MAAPNLVSHLEHSLQAPTPDTVALFDDVLLMADGYEVSYYIGPAGSR
jgi:hypothetical protein